MQIDPKPSDGEGLYVAMGGNPINKIDALGDTTIFYSANGTELLRTTEHNKQLGNVVTFVSDEKLEKFNSYLSILNSDNASISEVCSVNLLRSQGESYDIKGVFAFVDNNARNYSTHKNWKPLDGKGPFINEATAMVEKRNGIWTINPETKQSGNNPFSESKIGVPVTFHTHDNEGRVGFDVAKNQKFKVASGPSSVGQDDSVIPKGSAILEMAAGKKAIYFYNRSGVVKTIDRDVFSPKYFKK